MWTSFYTECFLYRWQCTTRLSGWTTADHGRAGSTSTGTTPRTWSSTGPLRLPPVTIQRTRGCGWCLSYGHEEWGMHSMCHLMCHIGAVGPKHITCISSKIHRFHIHDLSMLFFCMQVVNHGMTTARMALHRVRRKGLKRYTPHRPLLTRGQRLDIRKGVAYTG
jgi:hypothetical protein